ncbi:calcium-binding protein [Paracoccus sp. PARArs4]|uniref:calcium-binding protein n=1 Tax=Paracoccus sp. PARArs4 TaxID=2853442 RepID=UPI0024A62956|nr:calcium-binding protein [Paracoccus sp. PARArs4]
MGTVSQNHFGANVIFNRDGLGNEDAFSATLKEINVHNLRYPGGGTTEDQTWQNGGLDKIFAGASSMNEGDDIISLREFLSYASEHNASVSIVIPTFQFYNLVSNEFDEIGFERYVFELEAALSDFPAVSINNLEIGNEYWGSKNWGAFTPAQYGEVANHQIPYLDSMIDRLGSQNEGWSEPAIGVQAGAQWRAEQREDGTWYATGARESAAILNQISPENLAKVGSVIQHSYPDANASEQKVAWAMDAMKVFLQNEHVPDDIQLFLTEFNVGLNTAVGVGQAYSWIDSFSQFVDAGVTGIDHWGITYDWLSNKLYDSRFPSQESADGEVLAIATPTGQIYDIAESYLIGLDPTDGPSDALADVLPEHLATTSFSGDSSDVTFIYNDGLTDVTIDLSDLSDEQHYVVHSLAPADSPFSTWYDEALTEPVPDGEIADARGDMNVISGPAALSEHLLSPNEMLVILATDPDANLILEGAHNQTDPFSGMTNDILAGAAGNDIVRGHVGDDVLNGGAGRDVLVGGVGDDTLSASNDGGVLIADAGDDEVAGGDGNDLIVLGDGSGTGLISLGEGGDLILIGSAEGAHISGFGDDDYVGLWGAFEHEDALLSASRADGEDLVIDLPTGGQVVFEGQADRLETFPEQVIDFRSQDEIFDITESYLNGLTDLQIEELFGFDQLTEEFPQHQNVLPSEEGALHYLDCIDAVMGRIEWVEHRPDNDSDVPGDDVARPPSGPGEPEEVSGEDPSSVVDDDLPAEEEPEEDDPAMSEQAACFVATAAYGNRLHPDVVSLRQFRDRHLKRFGPGRLFIRFYWVIGPKLARRVRSEDVAAAMARMLLTGLVKCLRSLKIVN